MKTDFYRFAVIGGDMRQVFLAKWLAEKGFSVIVFGLAADIGSEKVKRAATLWEACEGANVIAAPMPLGKAENILDDVPSGCLLFAGGLSEAFLKKAEAKGIFCRDYLTDIRMAVKNTVATAEGAVTEAILRSSCNLHGSGCLVLGYGKCGSMLVSCLKSWNCRVTVCEPDAVSGAKASVVADEFVEFSKLPEVLGTVRFIFNTAPEMVLTESLLKCVKRDTLLLDIASAPGGVDGGAAERLGLNYASLPGLPGKYAPETSAEIMAEKIMSDLSLGGDQ